MGTDQAGDRRAPVSRRGELTCVGPRLCDKPSKLAVLPTQLPRSDFAAQSYLPRPPAVAIHANKSRRSRRYDLRVAAEKGLGCVSQRRRRREMAGIGATSSLPHTPAKVCLLNPQPSLRLAGGTGHSALLPSLAAGIPIGSNRRMRHCRLPTLGFRGFDSVFATTRDELSWQYRQQIERQPYVGLAVHCPAAARRADLACLVRSTHRRRCCSAIRLRGSFSPTSPEIGE